MVSELDYCANRDPLMPRISCDIIIAQNVFMKRGRTREIRVHINLYTLRVIIHGSGFKPLRLYSDLRERDRVVLVGIVDEVLGSYLDEREWQKVPSGEIHLNFNSSGNNPLPTEVCSLSPLVA